MFMARTADAGEAVKPTGLLKHPPLTQPFNFQSNVNGFKYTIPAGSLAFAASPSWYSLIPGSHNPSFEATGVNSEGVSMTATETIINKDEALAVDALNFAHGVSEDAIVSVVLPQARSAKHGAALLGGIMQERGSSEGFGVAFMDKKEIWYFETATSHRWLAQKLPDDHYFVAGNQGRFTDIPPDSIGSDDLQDFAFGNGLCNSSRPFSFFDCYMRNTTEDWGYYNAPRVAQLQLLYSKNKGPDYPLFMRPLRKLSVWDVIKGMRDTYSGTPLEPYMSQNPHAPARPIALLRTQLTHVTQQRPQEAGLPEELTYIEWVAWGMSNLSPFLPLYLRALPQIPARLARPLFQIDDTSMYWIVRRLQAVIFQDYPNLAPDAIAVITQLERDAADAAEDMERRYKSKVNEDPAAAAQIVQDFTDTAVEEYAAVLGTLTLDLALKAGLGPINDSDYVRMLVKAEALYHFHVKEGAGPRLRDPAAGQRPRPS